MKSVIVTVGTSLIRNFYNDIKDVVDFSIFEKSAFKYEEYVSKLSIVEEILLNKAKNNAECCAELASLIHLLKKHNEINIYLISSDTLSSFLIAQILKEVLLGYKSVSKVYFGKSFVAKNLKISTKTEFEEGIESLLDIVYRVLKKEKRVIFDITGGFKGVIPYFSTIAQIFDCEIIYDFEGKDNELIEIKPLPVEFDRGILELFYPYLLDQSLITDIIESKLSYFGFIKDKKLTPLGKIALWTFELKAFDKSLLGYFMEHIVYEYFSRMKNQNRFDILDFKYTNIELSSKTKNSDIDILLENDNEFIWIEIKPLSYLFKLRSLKNQTFKKQLKDIENFNKKIKKYVVIFYGFDDNFLEKYKNSPIIDFKKRVRRKVKVDAEFYFVHLPLAKKDKSGYSTKSFRNLLQNFKIDKLISLI